MVRRSKLKRCFQQIADRLRVRDYSSWSQQPEVWTFACVFEGSELQVEVEVLEVTQAYVHLMVAVDDGGLLWSHFPAATSFLVDNPAVQESRARPG
jgi:hypothetical protein